MGNFVNVGVLLILLCICNVQSIAEQTSHPNRLGTVWRLAFGLGIIPIVGIWLYRVFVLKVRAAADLNVIGIPRSAQEGVHRGIGLNSTYTVSDDRSGIGRGIACKQ